jgi:hypothetical protein
MRARVQTEKKNILRIDEVEMKITIWTENRPKKEVDRRGEKTLKLQNYWKTETTSNNRKTGQKTINVLHHTVYV